MASRGFIRGGREALGFWVITLGLCVLVGLGSYGVGRNWVGRTLGEAISSENVQIKAHQPAASAANALTDNSVSPPAQPKVDLEPRNPTDAEQQDLTAQGLSNSVEGSADAGGGAATDSGADASSGSATDSGADAGSGSATPSPPADTASPSASASGSYQVTAGSYTSAAKARRVKSALEQLGYTPTLTIVQRHGATYHQVVAGAYDDQQQAESVRKELQAAGYEAQVSGG